MIVMPSEKIKGYISVDENGDWIHDPNMPKELESEFEEFVKEAQEAQRYKDNFK